LSRCRSDPPHAPQAGVNDNAAKPKQLNATRGRPTRRDPGEAGNPTPDERAVEEAETGALVIIQKALVPLALESKRKVLRWFATNYSVTPDTVSKTVGIGERGFEDLAALFEAVHPRTDVERALAACYFRNEVLHEGDVDARSLAKDLRQIGHKLGNISSSLLGLNVRTPSLVMIVSGNKAHHKRFRITSAGTKYILEMMRRRSES
jgi:hypothetical protein